eukprot:g13024.t1
MAEGFTAADYVTDIRLSEVKGKRLWLVRVPRHIDPARLEGAKVKLPVRKVREGKVLGRVTKAGDSDGSDQKSGEEEEEEEDLVVRAADVAESAGFRALFSTEEDGPLSAAGPFAGQLNVSVETADLEPVSLEDHPPVVTFVEPYRGRPQLKGMRVRSKPAGAGSEYKRTRPVTNHDHDHDHDRTGKGDHTPPATPDQDKGGKRNSHADSLETTTPSQPRQSPAAGSRTGSKKKKRKSTGGGGAAVEGEQARSTSPTAKKSKKKKTAER